MTKNRIFQHNSFHTLYSGFYKGTITAQEALMHGGFGIGTLDGADGEIIILDGIVYHGNSQNQVREVLADETLPYAVLLDFSPSEIFDYSDIDSTDFLADLSEKFSKNSLYAVKITGNFKLVEITSKPAHNTDPYEVILQNQPHFTRRDVIGTMIGIWSPTHLESLFGSGFHLHFLSHDKTFGAHVASFKINQAKVELSSIEKIEQEFASNDENFQKINL